MPRLPRLPVAALLLVACMASVSAWADGLADLKAALARYPASGPINAQAEVKTHKRDGDEKDVDEKNGQAGLILEESPTGLRLQYSKETLTKLAADEQTAAKDAKAKTPTLSALGALNITELRQLSNAVPVLQRQLDIAVFKTEKNDSWNNTPARLLSFDYGVNSLAERDRKYVKKYEGSLDIWIAADGTPLASRVKQSASGSAYVIISFDMKNQEDIVFNPVGDRLTMARKESANQGSGAGQRGESRTVRTLQVLH